ncbi:MAG: hypothetical protein ACJAZ0_000463 [Halioglobus sp.]|jgi:hypothetical protein
MNMFRLAATAGLLVASATSFAAKPTSIVFEANDKTTDSIDFSKYSVKCSNGKKVQLTAWENRRKWCVGDASSQQCEKKQINAAKAACKTS